MIKDYDFRDFAGAAARAFNTLRFEPDKGLNQALQTIQQQRTANRAKNKTVEYLKGLGTPMGDRLAAMVGTGQLKGSQAYGMIFDMEKEARAAARATSAADLAFDRRVQLAEAGNEFTAEQNLLGREATAAENLLGREATATENLLGRESREEENELKRQAEIKAASDRRNYESNEATREFNRSLKKSAFEAQLKAKYPQSDTSAFSAKLAHYKKAFPDLSDAEVLEKMNSPDLPAEIRAIDARIERMGIEPNSEAARILYTYGEKGVEKFMIDTAKEAAKASAQLPSAKVSYDLSTKLVDDLLADPRLDSVVGPAQGRLPNVSGGANRVQSKIDQLVGQAYLQAREFLRGGGQITEKEADKAEAAFARFQNQNMSDADYRQALMDFRDAVATGYEKMKAAAAKGEKILSLEKILGFDVSGEIVKETQSQIPVNTQNDPRLNKTQEVLTDEKGKYVLIDRGNGVMFKQRVD